MRREISLDGTWQRRDFLDEAWRWSDALRAPSAATPPPAEGGPPVQGSVSAGWRDGRVPGATLDDAWRAGEVPNPYLDRDSLAGEWVAARTWVYRRMLRLPDEPFAVARLRFGGIDPGGSVFLDGEQVGEVSGPFLPLVADVSERLRRGEEHVLSVVVEAAPDVPSQVGRTEEVRFLKSRMGYGWDFCPRIINTGIWRPVTLELLDEAWIDEAWVRSAVQDEVATLRVEPQLAGEAAGTELTLEVTGPDGRAVATVHGSLETRIERPELWCPNGSGGQPRYTVTLRLAKGDRVLDERSVRIGLRSLAVVPNEGADAEAPALTFVVNGRRTYERGWNWTPVDALYGVPRPEKVRHLVELARRANVNMLRVWGGGLIEDDVFYDACDEAGIMVWQEFIQSSSGVSNTPSDDPAFIELLREQAEAMVRGPRNHPSLAAWCGGNELTDADGRPLDASHPALAALHDVVERLDPGRPWFPTSPSGRRFDNSVRALDEDPAGLHDVHGPWEHQGLRAQHDLANRTTSLFHSEYGSEGMANPETLDATISQRYRWPADRSNPVYAHRGAWWINAPLVEAVFGGRLGPAELQRASQYLQADGLRTLVEGDRRRKWRSSGTLPWQLNEPFPNAWGTYAVDYFGVPKAAYFAVAAAYAPVAVGAAFESQVLEGATVLPVRPWAVNDTTKAVDGELQVELHDGTGRPLGRWSRAVEVATDGVWGLDEPAALEVGEERRGAAEEIVVLDVRLGTAMTRYLLGRGSDLACFRATPATALAWRVVAAGDAWQVTLRNEGTVLALPTRLADARPVGWPVRAGQAYLSDNFPVLLPGEVVTIEVEWRGVPARERRLALSGWNVRPVELRTAERVA